MHKILVVALWLVVTAALLADPVAGRVTGRNDADPGCWFVEGLTLLHCGDVVRLTRDGVSLGDAEVAGTASSIWIRPARGVQPAIGDVVTLLKARPAIVPRGLAARPRLQTFDAETVAAARIRYPTYRKDLQRCIELLKEAVAPEAGEGRFESALDEVKRFESLYSAQPEGSPVSGYYTYRLIASTQAPLEKSIRILKRYQVAQANQAMYASALGQGGPVDPGGYSNAGTEYRAALDAVQNELPACVQDIQSAVAQAATSFETNDEEWKVLK